MSKKKTTTDSAAAIAEMRRLADAEALAAECRYRVDPKSNAWVEPAAAYFLAVESLFNAYDPLQMPHPRPEMEQWRVAFDRLQNALTARDLGMERDPTWQWQSFWNARDAAQKALRRDAPSPVERLSPSLLYQQGSTPATIAREWCWKLPNGEPDIGRVARELNSPGSEWTQQARDERHEFDLVQLGFKLTDKQRAELEKQRGDAVMA